jgi:hypothetical protein
MRAANMERQKPRAIRSLIIARDSDLCRQVSFDRRHLPEK